MAWSTGDGSSDSDEHAEPEWFDPGDVVAGSDLLRQDPGRRGERVFDDPGAPQATEVGESGDLDEDNRRWALVA